VSIDNMVLGPYQNACSSRCFETWISQDRRTLTPTSRHFGLNYFVMYVNGKQVTSEGLSLNTANSKTCTMAYQTLFSGLGIHHGNTGIQITPAQFMKGSFMLIFDLTPDGCASGGHTSLPDDGNIRIELKFDEALADAMTILLYNEFDASIQIDRLRNVLTDL